MKIKKPVVISMTTWKGRIYTSHKTIDSLLKQDYPISKIVVTLSMEEFSESFKDSIIDDPSQLKWKDDPRLEIRWVTGNPKAFKKLIPTLDAYPESIVITVDDDIEYPSDTISSLLSKYSGKRPIGSFENENDYGVPSGCLCLYERRFFGDLLHFFDCEEIISTNEDDWVYWAIIRLNGLSYDFIPRIGLADMQTDYSNGLSQTNAYDTSKTLEILNAFCMRHFGVTPQLAKGKTNPIQLSENRPIVSYILEKGKQNIKMDQKPLFGNFFGALYDAWTGRDDWDKQQYVSLGNLQLPENAKEEVDNGAIYTGTPLRMKYGNGIQYSFEHNVDEYKTMMLTFTDEDTELLKKAMVSDLRYDDSNMFMSCGRFLDFCSFIFGHIEKFMQACEIHTYNDVLERVRTTQKSYNNGKSVEENANELIPSIIEELVQIWLVKNIDNITHISSSSQ